MIYKDQLKRPLQFKTTPKRIISLVPSQTELLIDLGLETSLVGITKFCVHPKHIQNTKTVVGGTKQVNFDKIAALRPDIILCNKEENTKEMIKELECIAPVHVSDIYTIKDCTQLIAMYGDLFLVQKKASLLIQSIQEEAQKFKTLISKKPKHKVAYFIWRNPWMVAASNTFINYVLELNNFENVFSDLERYPEITLDDVKQKNVDYLLLSSEPYPFKNEHIKELLLDIKTKVILVDGEYFSWYGSRLVTAFNYFTKLHQEHL